MFGQIKEFFLRREISKLVQEQGYVTGVITWFTAVPGRKRGAAALILGVSASMRYLGHAAFSEHMDQAAQFIQDLQPGMDIVGGLMLILGFGHAVKRPTVMPTPAGPVA